MPGDLKLFVVDTGPLITLAAAQSLDYLLYVDADLVIPEQVFELAAKVGPIPSRAEKFPGHDEATRSAIQGLMKRPGSGPG